MLCQKRHRPKITQIPSWRTFFCFLISRWSRSVTEAKYHVMLNTARKFPSLHSCMQNRTEDTTVTVVETLPSTTRGAGRDICSPLEPTRKKKRTYIKPMTMMMVMKICHPICRIPSPIPYLSTYARCNRTPRWASLFSSFIKTTDQLERRLKEGRNLGNGGGRCSRPDSADWWCRKEANKGVTLSNPKTHIK